MSIRINSVSCVGCKRCAEACPGNLIKIVDNKAVIKREKDSILSLYFSEDSETQVGKMIQDITNQGIAKDSLFELLNFVLNEHYYNLLLALDGESSLDGEQINYKLFDEEGILKKTGTP